MLLVIDLSHIAYRSLFAARKDIQEIGWSYFKHMMYSNVLALCKKFDPDEVMLAVDSKENWRKKYYPEYKENRKEAREKNDEIDWNAFFTSFKEFVADAKEHFPFYVMEIKYLEADDIIGILAKEYQHKEKIVVSSDGDFIQLLKYKNFKLFDSMKNCFTKCDDPIHFLKVKCLMGDAGDNVKSVKPRVGEKTAEKIVNDPELFTKLFEDTTPAYTKEDGTVVTIGEECKEKYKLNIILMDLSKTPVSLVDKFKSEYDNYELPTGKTIFQFFSQNKYRELMRKMEDMDSLVKKLRDYKKDNALVTVDQTLFS